MTCHLTAACRTIGLGQRAPFVASMICLPTSGTGAGSDFINESNLNWVDLIEIAKYCNEQVEYQELNDEGELVTEKEARFAINTVIGSQAEAFSVLQDMASVFRGMLLGCRLLLIMES